MITTSTLPTVLQLVRGELRILGWPVALRPPFGLHLIAGVALGPPRLRPRVHQALRDAELPFTDEIATPPLQADELPPSPSPEPLPLSTWRTNLHQGLLGGASEGERIDFVLAAVHRGRVRALVVVRDSGAVVAWQRALAERGLPTAPCDSRPSPAAVVTVADAARTMHWRARTHELLVVDRPEQMPPPTLALVLDGSAALQRIGFVDLAGLPRIPEWSAGLGSLLAVAAAGAGPRRVVLHLPLSPAERAEHDAAWHMFLGAFDAFVAGRPDAGFGTFVQQARGDPRQRAALTAWHRANHVAAWNVAKAEACADLLARHRGDRVLVFAPDRNSSYALSLAHLIAPVTAELPRSERRATLAAFASGGLRALVGPRLLDLGVPAGSADVGVLVGGGFGEAQRQARIARVATTGIVYELVAQDTVEVGRAHRLERRAATAP